jgi:replicative DNA helicase
MSEMRAGRAKGEDWSRLVKATERLGELGVQIEDPRGSFDVRQLPLLARRMAAGGMRIMFVDYLQLMHGDQRENREREIASIAQACKETARACDIALVALAQLNRASEGRTDKKPVLSDLRESGSQEAHADAVGLLHNPRPKENESRQHAAEIIWAKQRNGRTGIVPVTWDGETQTFSDTEQYRDVPAGRDYSGGGR